MDEKGGRSACWLVFHLRIGDGCCNYKPNVCNQEGQSNVNNGHMTQVGGGALSNFSPYDSFNDEAYNQGGHGYANSNIGYIIQQREIRNKGWHQDGEGGQMVACAGDGVVNAECQIAALVVPSSQAVEEVEVPENTLWVPQSIVDDIKGKGNIIDDANGLDKHDLPIDDIEGWIDFVSCWEHIIHWGKCYHSDRLISSISLWYVYLHGRIKVTTEGVCECGFVEENRRCNNLKRVTVNLTCYSLKRLQKWWAGISFADVTFCYWALYIGFVV